MSQKQRVIDRILETGSVDNFWSIENRVSLRLGAIIFNLRNEGWEFQTEYIDTHGSNKNFRYTPTVIPEKYKKVGQMSLI